MIVELPWPPRELSPNAREGHWSVRRRASNSYRESAYWLTKSKAVDIVDSEYPVDGSQVLLQIQFFPPDKRKRDLDNMLASVKAGLDGIADALQINDQRFALNISRGSPVKGGKVMVKLG